MFNRDFKKPRINSQDRAVYCVQIRNKENNNIIKEIPTDGRKQAEKIRRGVLINFNHKKFSIAVIGRI